ncbi:RNA polymerase, sigma 27/28 subunit, RpsK/SigK [Syntrophobotulus glycolicus DSM 8271]|uniref:RNA polymerase sigma factor n=1 Tax=Syntrophobotulus glycolicus (strain DSM 8271 / FlGlyR) TaxID=645991 RepID=F0T0U3_SYNGF|nr:RNA polymerase sporulation sigma factor SigK [Syntrophobotulus glycolicus]ADY56232.1 RNA polymerase, sigma 27/28 subunit, RpsK/SigK [Syntrophobotulus glycolicus DSM 8271]
MITELFFVGAALSILKGITLLVSYINNNAFPQPLSEAEEAQNLKILAESKGEPANKPTEIEVENARNKLIEHNLRLVAHLVKKYDGTGEDSDDLISIGTIGLIKGINTFNTDKGTRLATYAARCIENEILMYLRTLKKTRGEVSMYDPIGTDKEGNSINLIDILGTDPDAISDQVESEFEQRIVLEKLKCLTKRERMVLQLRFGLLNSPKKTQREIARMLGISRSYVSRIEKKAVQKLTEEMKEHRLD